MIREGDSHIFYDIERDVLTGHCSVCTVQCALCSVQPVKIYDNLLHSYWQAHFTSKQEISEKQFSGAWRSCAKLASGSQLAPCSLPNSTSTRSCLSTLKRSTVSPVSLSNISCLWFVKKFFLSVPVARNCRSRREISLIKINKQSEIL